MKTQGWVAIVLATVLVAVSVPANADFHGDCTGFATAYANTGLSAEQGTYGTDLVYEGLVNCPGSAVDIHDVTVAPAADTALDSTSNEGCQATLNSPCTAESAVNDPGPGYYDVNMTFSTQNFPNVERLQTFYWDGLTQPVPTCVNAGFFPIPSQPGCLGLGG